MSHHYRMAVKMNIFEIGSRHLPLFLITTGSQIEWWDLLKSTPIGKCIKRFSWSGHSPFGLVKLFFELILQHWNSYTLW